MIAEEWIGPSCYGPTKNAHTHFHCLISTHLFQDRSDIHRFYGLICWAEQYIESSLAALLVASVPLFMGLIETTFPQKYCISGLGWVGLIIGCLGVIYLVSPHFDLEGQTFLAVLGVLFASFNWAVASIYLKRRPDPPGSNYNLVQVSKGRQVINKGH